MPSSKNLFDSFYKHSCHFIYANINSVSKNDFSSSLDLAALAFITLSNVSIEHELV